MDDDPDRALGVAKTAAQDEIAKACPKLVKQLDPDLHPGDAGRQAGFQAVSATHDLLSDLGPRRCFDAGEIDATMEDLAAQWRTPAAFDPRARLRRMT